MDHDELLDWLDRHHVHVLRMEGTLPDGQHAGRFIHRDQFVRTLPLGMSVSWSILSTDVAGASFEELPLGDREEPHTGFFQRPDLATLITDGTDPDLGHCIVDLVDGSGRELALCPRSRLRSVLARLRAHDLGVRVAAQLQFSLFRESRDEARALGYRALTPLTGTASRMGYLARNAYPSQPFMNEVARRLEWRGIPWESWHADGGAGKIVLDLAPCGALAAADRIVRARQALFEIAADQGCTVSFMANPVAGNECRLGLNLTLLRLPGERATAKPPAPVDTTRLLDWATGLHAAEHAGRALLYPTVNAYRALPPATRLEGPGDEHPSATTRMLPCSSDANPYLALTVLIGGGLAGLDHALGGRSGPPARDSAGQRPASLADAIAALDATPLLDAARGSDLKRYWLRSRHWEQRQFAGSSAPAATEVTDWELARYFELS